MTNYEVHPAALLFPLMGDDELGKLADDIAANGLLEPVVLYHDQVLDGRNRLAACQLADVKPRFMQVDGELPSPTMYVLSKNLHRRHLTVSQRAAIAADTVPLLQEEAHMRQVASLKNQQPASCPPFGGYEDRFRAPEIAAKELQVGTRTVERALEVKRKDPEAFERVKAGEITVGEAAREEEKRQRRKAPPGELNGNERRHAETYKERMVKALSGITGFCRGLKELNVDSVLSVCDEEEKETWVERAKDLSSQLRAFAVRLQKGNVNVN